jgi:hypothetical protein
VPGNLSRDPLHVGGFPCKHVEVRFEEVDERAFLLRIECHLIWSVRPSSETTASLTSLVGSKEQVTRLDDSGTSGPRIEARRGASRTLPRRHCR